MNSQEYWAAREDEQLKHYITDEKEYDKEIKRIYAEMLDNVQKEINSFYGKYADKEGITLAEAKKRVSQLDIAAYERKAARYVKDKDFSAKANEEMRLYNATMKINRLELLKANIGLDLISGTEELNKFMEGILKGRTIEELQRQAGILGKTVKNNAAKAHAIVNGSYQVESFSYKGKRKTTFSEAIWQYQDLMRYDIGELLRTGLIRGKNPNTLAKDLKKLFYGGNPKKDGGYTFCAQRLMRTELARVQTEAQKQSFERNGFSKYIFIKNGGCCSKCEDAANNDIGYGKGVYLVKDMMPGENASPMHPLCRCSTAAYEDSADYKAWLEYLNKGGTTGEWKKIKATQNSRGFAAKVSGEGVPEHEEPILLKTIDYNDKVAVNEVLINFEKNAIMEAVETACVITRDGKVYKCFGTKDRVFADFDLGEELRGATMSHNHPITVTSFSFSEDDMASFIDYDLDVLRGCDERYIYEFTRDAEVIDELVDKEIDLITDEESQHYSIIIKAKLYGIGYRRWKNE